MLPDISSTSFEGSVAKEGLWIEAQTIDITPDRPMPLAGYAKRAGNWKAVESRLEANIVFLCQDGGKPIFLIALDTLFASNWLIDEVVDLLAVANANVDRDALIFVASHTHFAPSLDPSKPRLGEFDPKYGASVAEKLADAILALGEMPELCDAKRRAGAPCTGAIYRRRKALQFQTRSPFFKTGFGMLPDPKRSIDRELQQVTFYTSNAQPIFTIATWPCHAVSAPIHDQVSSDFVGAIRTAVRDNLGARVPVIFLPGFCGDIRPDFRPSFFDIRRWLSSPFGSSLSFARSNSRHFSDLKAKVKDAVNLAFEGAIEETRPTTLEHRRQKSALNRIVEDTDEEFELGLLRLGGLDLLYIGAEVCGDHAKPLYSLLQPGALLTGVAGQVFGYWPTPEQIVEGGYEVERFKSHFSLRAGDFKPTAQSWLVATVEKLAGNSNPKREVTNSQ